MSTLYLRNVPDDLLARLRKLAARHGLSVSAMAVRELSQSTRWVDNAEVLGELGDLDIAVAAVIEALDEARSARAT